MILDSYKAAGLFFNTNFYEATSQSGLNGYRGDLILVDGGLDDKGHPNPPEEVIRGAVVLADEKIKMLVAGLDRIDQLPVLLEKLKADFADGIKIILFVVNSKNRMLVDIDGVVVNVIPLVQGVPWNEAVEELALEKSDFKGLSPADKLVRLYEEFSSYKPKTTVASMDELLSATTNEVRQVWGAV